MRKVLREFFDSVVCKKVYWMSQVFFCVLAYGFSITNRTIGIDNLRWEEYYNYLNIQELRWGSNLYMLIGSRRFSPFAPFFIWICLIIVATIIMSCVLYVASSYNKEAWRYLVFSALFVTYPLVAEIWSYAMWWIGVGQCSAALAVLYTQTRKQISMREVIVTSLLLLPMGIGYEAVFFFYITLVCIVLFIEYVVYNTKTKGWFMQGVIFAIPLGIVTVVRFVVGRIILSINDLPVSRTGQTQINWGTMSLAEIIKEMAYNGYYYVIRAFEYMPIGVWLSAVIVFLGICILLCIRSRRIKAFFFGGMVVLSLFALAIMQGSFLQYRMAMGMPLFVAFTGWLVIIVVSEWSEISNRKYIKSVVIGMLLYLAFQQGIYLHNILALDNQRSENEVEIARQIGYRLKSEYEDKIVIFVGELDLGNWIESQIIAYEDSFGGSIEHAFREIYTPGEPNYRYVDTVVKSHMNWSLKTGQVGQRYMGEYLSYLGYDVKVDENMTWERLEGYKNIADEMQMKPLSICDMGDYILVNLG